MAETIKTATVDIDIKKISDKQDLIIKKFEKMEKASSKSNKTFLENAANISLAYSGVVSVVSQLTAVTEKYTKAATIQQLADARLESIAKKVTKATESQIKSLEILADKLQNVTTFGDEVLQVGQSQLLSYGLQTKSVEKLSESIADLIAQQNGITATGDNARNIADLLGRAYSGQVGALTRVGIRLNEQQKELLKTGDELTKVNTLVEIVSQNYGGLARSLAQTDPGAIKQIENAIGDLEEEIGEELLPTVLEFKRQWLEIAKIITPIIKGVLSVTQSAGADFSRAIREFRQYGEGYKELAKTLSKKELDSLLKQLNERISDPSFLDTDSSIENMTNLRNVLSDIVRNRGLEEYAGQVRSAAKATEEFNEIEDLSLPETEFKDSGLDEEEKLPEGFEGFSNAEIEEAESSHNDALIELEKEKQDTLNEIREQAREEEEKRRQASLDKIKESIAIISELQTGISNIFSQMSTNRMIEIDNEYKKQKENINKTIKNEDARNKAVEKADKEYQQKKRDQQKKNAENEKIASLFQVAINTASAIVEALPNIPLSIAVGVLGATQAGIIAAQPIPEFATGVVNLQGPGTATSDSIPARLSKGESVVTAAGTAAGANASIISNMNTGQSFTNATGEVRELRESVRGMSAIMANMSRNVTVINEVSREGLTSQVVEGNNDFNNDNNRLDRESSL